MTIHVVIPVFNRLALTQSLIACLRRQVVEHPIKLLVVDDGSTDGTGAWLSEQSDIEVMNGDGNLFWGGAVDLAVRHILARNSPDDWVLLMNNDTTISDDFVQRMLDAALACAPAAVGSVIRDIALRSRLLSIGARLDAWRLLTSDIIDAPDQAAGTSETISVDALSGRGALFPLAALAAAGGLRPRLLPHYLADYELSLRVRKSGWSLLVVHSAAVYSSDDYGNSHRPPNWRERLTSIRSPSYLPALLVFWWEASNWIQRISLPLRLPFLVLWPRLRKGRA